MYLKNFAKIYSSISRRPVLWCSLKTNFYRKKYIFIRCLRTVVGKHLCKPTAYFNVLNVGCLLFVAPTTAAAYIGISK